MTPLNITCSVDSIVGIAKFSFLSELLRAN